MTWSTWTPSEGETVHLRRDNPWSLAAGRYALATRAGGLWMIYGEDGPAIVPGADLVGAEAAGILTPIGAAELDRERHEVQLRVRAPLRGNRRGAMLAQHDASALPLFTAACEPRFI